MAFEIIKLTYLFTTRKTTDNVRRHTVRLGAMRCLALRRRIRCERSFRSKLMAAVRVGSQDWRCLNGLTVNPLSRYEKRGFVELPALAIFCGRPMGI